MIYDGTEADMGVVNIQCGSGTTSYSCDSMTIDAEYVYALNLLCQGSLLSNYYPCDDVTLNADYATNVVITADGRYTGYDDTWNVIYAKNVTLNARGYQALYTATIRADYAKSLVVNLAADSISDETARYMLWYVPTNVTFNCFGYGCYYLGTVYRSSNSSDGLQINVDGCDICTSVEKCVYNIDLNCGSATDYWQNGSCNATHNDC